jgi:hypothetical protein
VITIITATATSINSNQRPHNVDAAGSSSCRVFFSSKSSPPLSNATHQKHLS